MIVVGLTGNYGMGKSTVARIFRELGAATIDTDELVRDILDEPATVEKVREAFGDGVVAGEGLNKKKLADMVFHDANLRISLENILHPRVFEKVSEALSRISKKEGPNIVVIEAPVLFERGYQNRFDKIITVCTSEDVAVSRLAAKGIPEDEARLRLKSQFPTQLKVKGSDYAVDNGNDPEETKTQVAEIFQELLAIEMAHGNN